MTPANRGNRTGADRGACCFCGHRDSQAVRQERAEISGGDGRDGGGGDGASDADDASDGDANDDGDADAQSNAPRWSLAWNPAAPPRQRRDWPATAPGRAQPEQQE